MDHERDFPVDPELDADEGLRSRPAGATVARPFARARRTRLPRIRWATVAAVAVGGFVGGLARYGVTVALPTTTGAFPWAIFAVNTAGAFILALLLIVVLEVLPPSTYLRPVLGTGFCGALTTFSSVVTGVDQLAAHGHAVLAAVYVLTSLAAGLAAASLGIVLGRSIATIREKGRD